MTVDQARAVLVVHANIGDYIRIDSRDWAAWLQVVAEAKVILAHSMRTNNCPYYFHASDCECGGAGGDR